MVHGLRDSIARFISSQQNQRDQKASQTKNEKFVRNEEEIHWEYWQPFFKHLNLDESKITDESKPPGEIILEYISVKEPCELEEEFERMPQDIRFSFLTKRLIKYSKFENTINYINNNIPKKWGIGLEVMEHLSEGEYRCLEHKTKIKNINSKYSKTKIEVDETISNKKSVIKGGDTTLSPLSGNLSLDEATSTSEQNEKHDPTTLSYNKCKSGQRCLVNKRSFVVDGREFLLETHLSPPDPDSHFRESVNN